MSTVRAILTAPKTQTVYDHADTGLSLISFVVSKKKTYFAISHLSSSVDSDLGYLITKYTNVVEEHLMINLTFMPILHLVQIGQVVSEKS